MYTRGSQQIQDFIQLQCITAQRQAYNSFATTVLHALQGPNSTLVLPPHCGRLHSLQQASSICNITVHITERIRWSSVVWCQPTTPNMWWIIFCASILNPWVYTLVTHHLGLTVLLYGASPPPTLQTCTAVQLGALQPYNSTVQKIEH